MSTELTIDLSDDLRTALRMAGYTPKALVQEARQALAASLFSKGVLSLEQAAGLAEMSLWDFIPFLGHQGIPVADYDEEDAAEEMESVRWLLNRKAQPSR